MIIKDQDLWRFDSSGEGETKRIRIFVDKFRDGKPSCFEITDCTLEPREEGGEYVGRPLFKGKNIRVCPEELLGLDVEKKDEEFDNDPEIVSTEKKFNFVMVRFFLPDNLAPVVEIYDTRSKADKEYWDKNSRWYRSQIIGYCAERLKPSDFEPLKGDFEEGAIK